LDFGLVGVHEGDAHAGSAEEVADCAADAAGADDGDGVHAAYFPSASRMRSASLRTAGLALSFSLSMAVSSAAKLTAGFLRCSSATARRAVCTTSWAVGSSAASRPSFL